MNNCEEKKDCEGKIDYEEYKIKNTEELKEEDNQYMNGMIMAVENMKRTQPLKYAKAQSIGKSVMNCSFELDVGKDEVGDKIIANKLLNLIRDYGVDKADLTNEENNIMRRVFGDKWTEEILY